MRQQVGGEAVDFEQLGGADETAEAVAVVHDAAGVGGTDAVEQLQGDGVGAVEFDGEWLAGWCGTVVVPVTINELLGMLMREVLTWVLTVGFVPINGIFARGQNLSQGVGDRV